jgi:rhodanese-related sulfurtransferase
MFVQPLTPSLLIPMPASLWGDTIMTTPYAAAAAAWGAVTIIYGRSPRKWRQTCIRNRSRTVTINNSIRRKAFIQEIDKAGGGERSKPVALIYAACVRSARALGIPFAEGFKNLQNISEGMMGHSKTSFGWLNRSFPTNSFPEC